MTAPARILRTAAGLLVIALLVYFGRLDLRVLEDAFQYPGLVVLAGSLLFLVFPMAALRWWLLTSALGYPMNLAWSVRTTFTGQFFNIFLPGSPPETPVEELALHFVLPDDLRDLKFRVPSVRTKDRKPQPSAASLIPSIHK